MSHYLSSILTRTTSKYNNLRRVLLSDAGDGDTEDDSHISRVLRAYYVEKSRPFPPWLPADPAHRNSSTSSLGQFSQSRNSSTSGPTRRGGGLSDLWDSPSTPAQPPPPPSLRNRSDLRGGPTSGRQMSSGPDRPPPGGARPMGSYNRGGSYNTPTEEPKPTRSGSTAAGSAQDRLKAKLGVARTANQGSSGSY